MGSQQAFSCSPILLRLQEHINHIAMLINGPPQVMLLAIDFDKDFIGIEGVAVTSVLSLQAAGINSSELDAEPAP